MIHNVSQNYRYEGEFKNGFRLELNFIILIIIKTKLCYCLLLIVNFRSGLGKEFYKSGSYYEGHFKQNFKHGKGRMTYRNGNYYEGDFVRGL